MSDNLTQKAVDMLLHGATLLSEPCPYCKGVRVMQNGNALCTSCGRKPDSSKQIDSSNIPENSSKSSPIELLEKKLNSLSKELESEKDHTKQQEILIM